MEQYALNTLYRLLHPHRIDAAICIKVYEAGYWSLYSAVPAGTVSLWATHSSFQANVPNVYLDTAM